MVSGFSETAYNQVVFHNRWCLLVALDPCWVGGMDAKGAADLYGGHEWDTNGDV